jgi:hypothetical protein
MLRTPEERLYQASWSDGSLDLVGGVATMVIGLGYVTDIVVATALAPPLAFTAWLLLRARVVRPRAGRAQPRQARRERSRRELTWTFGVGVTLLVLAAIAASVLRSATPTAAVDGLPALLMALLSLAAAALTRSPRFAWYAATLVAAGVVTVLLGTGPGMPLIVGGGVATVAGGVLLAAFLADTREVE